MRTASSTETIIALLNPRAGGAEGAREALERSGGFEVREVVPSRLAGEVAALSSQGVRRVAVAGGDGSIAAAAGALAGQATELAIIPAGTLNHFARDLGIPVGPDEAVTLAREGMARPVDVARVNDRVFLNTSSVGAYVLFVRARERFERSLGYRLASVLAAASTLARTRSFRVELDVDGSRRTYATLLVFVGVGERELRVPMLGGRLADGRRGLHLLIPRVRTPYSLLGVALRGVVHGVRPLRSAMLLDSFVVKSCRITLRRRRGNVATDGEVEPMLSPLTYELLHEALRVVAPPAEQPAAE